ncbi:PREDICTED: zinc finger MYM-type protein 1-like [Lupinus angustifolius]|uniref:zinc finger MYM-type protein 1-like n=1 Tax=Lupinus angustifolius TaxID=3871 RepID=UPI00092EAE44|nr:PREDICTED: zinc finger MYM-type protein 1-like [Lupinus angustifolius]
MVAYKNDFLILCMSRTLHLSLLKKQYVVVSNIRGQGYDGASNMRGEWNGLQALFLKDCSYAYYVHCFAHRLQLALVAASREVIVVHEFFSKLTFIVNIMCSSSKRHDELQAVKLDELEHLLEIDELITDNGSSSLKRVDADVAYNTMTSFEFILILHMMKEIMGITDCLCQALQLKSQDIVNAMQLVRTTKELIQKLTDGEREWCARHQKDHITFEHHYSVNIFLTTIDKQLQELNRRFSKQTMELLTLSTSLDPKDVYKTFNINNICILVQKIYPMDFNDQEKINLRYQLQHFILDALSHSDLKNISIISELSAALIKTGKVNAYYLLDRVIRLILTLPVSTATTERSFSAMKIIKTRLRSKMEDEFLADNMVIYIEKEIAETFTSDSIIGEFKSLKERRAAL